MSSVPDLLKSLQFAATHPVAGRASIADLFKPKGRCGIYVLHFATGERYVGQALDVTRRYVQHCKAHGDIEQISFKRMARKALNEAERQAIWAFERQGIPLRNITFTSVVQGETDFELIMPRAEQEAWLTGSTPLELEGERPIDLDLRRKYQQRYLQLANKPFFAEAAELLRTYVYAGLPAPRRSELTFWACSCLPGTFSGGFGVYTRINIYWQEVCTIGYNGHSLFLSLHLARSPLKEGFLAFRRLKLRHPGMLIDNQIYKPGGSDQIHLRVDGVRRARQLLGDPDVISAIRLFNLRQMNKGPCVFNRYHCFDLADQALGGQSETTP
jgi:hypothetical protein